MRIALLALLLVAAVPASAQTADRRALCPLASALTKLAKAVDAYASTAPNARNMTGEQVIREATRHDPAMLNPFFAYHLDALVLGENSAVLVCTADQSQGLLEDAGCSARLDVQTWADNRPLPCGFTLDLGAVCSGAPMPRPVNHCQ